MTGEAITDEEYVNILDHLLSRLRTLDQLEVADEINLLISRSKTVIAKDDEDLKRYKIKQSDVGKTQSIPITPKEALELAIDYLSKIIIEVPSYAQSIRGAFGTSVIWEYDQIQLIRSISTSSAFNLNSISFNEEELEEAKNELQKIKTYLKE